MFLDTSNQLQHRAHTGGGAAHEVAHHRHKFLTKGDRHLLKAFASLIQARLYCVVLHIELFGYRRGFVKGFLCFLLLPYKHIDVSRQGRDDGGRACTVFPHILENRCKDIYAAQFVQPLNKHKQSLICGAAQGFVELVKVKTCGSGYLVRFLEQVHDNLGESRGGHLHFLPLAIQDGSKAHNLRDGHIRLRSYSGETLRKLRKVGRACRAVLRQLIDNRTYREQRTFSAKTRLIAENSGQFGERKRGTIPQIIQCHIYLVCGFHKAQHIFLRGLAQASGFLRQFVQLLAACPRVYLLEGFVKVVHLLLGQPRVLAHIGFLLLYLGVHLHGFLARHHGTGEGGDGSRTDGLPLLKLIIKTLQPSGAFLHLIVHTPYLVFEQPDFPCLLVPSR